MANAIHIVKGLLDLDTFDSLYTLWKTWSNNPLIPKPEFWLKNIKKLPNKMHQISPRQQTGCP